MILRTPFAAVILAVSVALPGAFAQTSVTTDPVGFTSLTIAAGSVRALSLPLNNIPDYASAISAATSSTLQTANAGWTTNAFGPFDSNPHVVRLLTGTNKGRQFRIASNTSDTLTLTTNGSDFSQLVAAGDRYAIYPVTTLAKLFGPDAPSLNRSSDPAAADNILVRGSVGWGVYYNDGVQWLREGGSGSENNAALLPEQGFLFVRRGSTAYDFTVTGAAPMTNLVTDLPADRATFLANRFPVSTTLVGLGLAQLPGWNASSNSGAADNVLVRSTYGWLTYYFDGTNWLREGGGTDPDNPTIASGSAVLVVKRSSASTLNQARPY